MPAPPITIGELTDVPTYDSAIASPWAQEVTRRTVHRFGSTGERDAKYPAAAAGAGALCVVAGSVLYISDGTTWVGRLRVTGQIFAPAGPGGGGGIIPGQVGKVPLARVTIPFASSVRFDLTMFFIGDGPWSGNIFWAVNGAQAFMTSMSATNATTVDVHPFLTVPAGAVVDLSVNYGAAGTGVYSWYLDPTNVQFSAECGQT